MKKVFEGRANWVYGYNFCDYWLYIAMNRIIPCFVGIINNFYCKKKSIQNVESLIVYS